MANHSFIILFLLTTFLTFLPSITTSPIYNQLFFKNIYNTFTKISTNFLSKTKPINSITDSIDYYNNTCWTITNNTIEFLINKNDFSESILAILKSTGKTIADYGNEFQCETNSSLHLNYTILSYKLDITSFNQSIYSYPLKFLQKNNHSQFFTGLCFTLNV